MNEKQIELFENEPCSKVEAQTDKVGLRMMFYKDIHKVYYNEYFTFYLYKERERSLYNHVHNDNWKVNFLDLDTETSKEYTDEELPRHIKKQLIKIKLKGRN